MLSIRLSRVGKKHQPSYRLIVLDKKKDPWGDYLENLGFYNPMVKPKVVQFKAERIKHWLGVGAQPTDTVWNLLVDQKIVEGSKRKKHGVSKKKDEAKTEAAPVGEAGKDKVKPAEGGEAPEVKAEEAPKREDDIKAEDGETKAEDVPKPEEKPWYTI